MANKRIGKGFLDAFDALGMVVSNPLILTALIPALAAGQDVVAVPSDDRETAQGCRTVPGQVVCGKAEAYKVVVCPAATRKLLPVM